MRKNEIRNKQKEPAKTRRIMVRLTDAELSGLTICAYARKRLNGEHPKRRMSGDEIVALSSLSDARGDIVKLFSFLRSKPHDERERIMRTQIFMSQWKAAAQQILNRMVEIEKNIS